MDGPSVIAVVETHGGSKPPSALAAEDGPEHRDGLIAELADTATAGGNLHVVVLRASNNEARDAVEAVARAQIGAAACCLPTRPSRDAMAEWIGSAIGSLLRLVRLSGPFGVSSSDRARRRTPTYRRRPAPSHSACASRRAGAAGDRACLAERGLPTRSPQRCGNP